MTWHKKSHRSSAPSNQPGRDGARPPHSSDAAGPPADPAVQGPAADPPSPSGRLGAHEASDEPDPRDLPDRPGARHRPSGRPEVPGPRDGARAPADSAPEQPTSSPPASGSSSSGSTDADDESPRPTVWAAARNFWPGTEDRQDEPDPPADEPDPDPEQGTYTFGGPLGAGPESNRQIWEPRRLHQVPRLRRAPRPTPSPEGTSQQGTSPQGTSQRDAAPQGPAPEPPSRPSRPGRPPHQDIPVRRLALPSGSTETPPRKRRDSRESNRAKRHRPTAGPAYAAASDYDGTARRAERSKVGDLMADNRMRIWRRRLLIAIAAGLVFSFIFTWRAGLTAAVLAAIADVIYRSRTTASMPAGGVRLTGAQLVGIAISLLGVLTIILRGDFGAIGRIHFNKGDLMFASAVLAFGLYSAVMTRRPVTHPLSLITFTMACGSIMLVPFAAWEMMSGFPPKVDWLTAATFAYAVIFPSTLAYLFFNRGIALIGPNRAAPFLHLVPVFGSVMAILLLGEELKLFHVIGYVLVLAGVVIASRQGSAKTGP